MWGFLSDLRVHTFNDEALGPDEQVATPRATASAVPAPRSGGSAASLGLTQGRLEEPTLTQPAPVPSGRHHTAPPSRDRGRSQTVRCLPDWIHPQHHSPPFLSRLQGRLTLFAEFFASFDRSTCALSVPGLYCPL